MSASRRTSRTTGSLPGAAAAASTAIPARASTAASAAYHARRGREGSNVQASYAAPHAAEGSAGVGGRGRKGIRAGMRRSLPLLAVALTCAAAPLTAQAATTRYASVAVAVPAPTPSGVRVLPPVRAPFRFDLAGVRWRPSGHAALDLRVRGSHGWSAWRHVEASDPAPGQDAVVRDGEPVWQPGSSAVQLRLHGGGAVSALHAAFVRAGAGPAVGVPARRRLAA